MGRPLTSTELANWPGTPTEELPVETAIERETIVSALAHDECAKAFAELMRPEFFVDPAYRAIAAEIIEQQPNGIDPQSIARNLKGHRAFYDGNAAGMLLELCNEYSTRHQFPRKCAAVVEASRLREQLADIENLQHLVCDREPSAEVCRATLDALNRWRQTATGFGRQGPISFGDLRTRFPSLRAPVIDGLAREGETINIISNTKIGKSWFIYCLALCVVLGRLFLNHFATRQGKVLIIDNELHGETLAYRIREVAAAMGIESHEYERDLVVWTLRGKRKTLDDIAAELMQFKPGEYSLILWDSKYRVERPGTEENSNDDERDFYNVADEIGDHTLAVNGFIHHATKGNQSDKRTTDIGAGGGAQSRATDCHLVLREHEEPGMVVLDAAVRSFAPIEPLVLRWEFPLWQPDHAADPGKLKRQPGRNEQRQADADREGMDATIKALRDGPATARHLRSKTGFGEYRQQRLLDLLTSQGHATQEEKNIGRKTYVEYQLSE